MTRPIAVIARQAQTRQRAATGYFRERIGFHKRVESSDGYGNTTSGYDEDAEFTVAANVAPRTGPRMGSEAVVAAALTGQSVVDVTVRYSSATLRITTDWIAKDVRSGAIYNIRAVSNPDETKQFISMLCEQGATNPPLVPTP